MKVKYSVSQLFGIVQLFPSRNLKCLIADAILHQMQMSLLLRVPLLFTLACMFSYNCEDVLEKLQPLDAFVYF